MKLRRGAGQIYQIAAMDRQRSNSIFLPQAAHLIALRLAQHIGLPLARAGGEYLKSIRSQPVSTLCRSLHSARSGSMDANPPGSRPGRLAFGPQQYVLHAELWLSPWSVWRHALND